MFLGLLSLASAPVDLNRRGFDGVLTQVPRLVESAEQQSGAAQRMVAVAVPGDDSPRRLTLEELLALPEPGERLARLADLCKDPRGVGDRAGKVEAVVPCPECRDPWFDQ